MKNTDGEVGYAIALKTEGEKRMLLPAYSFEGDAKLAASRLIELSTVVSVKLLKVG